MMNYLKNWNPINTIENIIVIIATALMMNFFVVKPLRNDLQQLQQAVIELAKEPKYSIDNDFGKMKAKDGSLVLDLNNNMNTQNLEQMTRDTFQTEKQTFWKKVFGKNK